MAKILNLAIVLFPISVFGQTPKQQGLIEYSIHDKGDTIQFYVYNPDRITKTKVFLYIQGSGELPMVNGDEKDACCYNNYPKKLMMAFPKEYAFVYIQKVGLPYYVRNIGDFSPSGKFNKRNNVSDRTEVADKVVNYLLKNVYPQATVVAVLGHSEGSDVAAKLATVNNKITHLCFASGNGTPEIFNDILLIRRQMQKGEIMPSEAQNQLDALFSGLINVYKSPNSTDSNFNGDTYKWNYEINKPPIENLLHVSIPIYLTIGSNDEKVPVEATDYIITEFIRHNRTNLVYKIYLDCNHGYKSKSLNGQEIDHWNDLFFDFLHFIEQHKTRAID